MTWILSYITNQLRKEFPEKINNTRISLNEPDSIVLNEITIQVHLETNQFKVIQNDIVHYAVNIREIIKILQRIL